MTKRDPTPITGKWGKHKLYACRLCAFSSLDKKQFEYHFANVHPPLRVIEGGKQDSAVTPETPEPTESPKGKED